MYAYYDDETLNALQNSCQYATFATVEVCEKQIKMVPTQAALKLLSAIIFRNESAFFNCSETYSIWMILASN